MMKRVAWVLAAVLVAGGVAAFVLVRRPSEAPPVIAPDAGTASAPGKAVVFRDAQGRTLTEEDLKSANGHVRWEIVGADKVSPEARKLHIQGQAEGQKREFLKAATSFYEANKLAPEWPYPVYDAAFVYLLVGNTSKAEELYARTVELSPRGFFTAITAMDALRKEREGTLPKGLYLNFTALESIEDPQRRVEILRQIVDHSPNFAPAWEKLAGELKEEDAQLDAIEKGLKADPDRETKGFLLVNQALHWKIHGKRQEAIEQLGRLALDPASTLQTEAAAKAALVFALR